MRNILILFTLLYCLTGKSQDLELSLVGRNTTFEVGQEIDLKLTITNLEGALIKGSDGG